MKNKKFILILIGLIILLVIFGGLVSYKLNLLSQTPGIIEITGTLFYQDKPASEGYVQIVAMDKNKTLLHGISKTINIDENGNWKVSLEITDEVEFIEVNGYTKEGYGKNILLQKPFKRKINVEVKI